MFYYASSFDHIIIDWNLSSLVNCEYIFHGANAFQQDLPAQWNPEEAFGYEHERLVSD